MNTKPLECHMIRYREFPDLLFMRKSADERFFYFDATHFIQKKGNPAIQSIQDFQLTFRYWIEAASKVYAIKKENLFVQDHTTGHMLIDECLALPFSAYIDHEFAVYMMERISEMLIHGIAVSDTWLLHNAKLRFKPEEE